MTSHGPLDWPTRNDDGHGTAAASRPKADRVGGRMDGFRRGGVADCASLGRTRTPWNTTCHISGRGFIPREEIEVQFHPGQSMSASRRPVGTIALYRGRVASLLVFPGLTSACASGTVEGRRLPTA